MKDSERPVAEPNKGMFIVSLNLIILLIYTVVIKATSNGAGFIADAFIIIFHVFICVFMASKERGNFWLLSALLVLIIGFSTCTNFFGAIK